MDGSNFYGMQASGDSGGWVEETLDLSDVYSLGDLRGRAQVWIAFGFRSDADMTDIGAFVDEVALKKLTSGATVAPPGTPASPGRLPAFAGVP